MTPKHPSHVLDSQTMMDLLLTAAEASREPIILPRVFGTGARWSYEELLTKALGLLDGVQHLAGRKIDHLVLAASDPSAFLPAFWACQLGGITAVPTAPIQAESDPNRERLAGVVQALGDPLVLCEDRFADITSQALEKAGRQCQTQGIFGLQTSSEGIVRPPRKDAPAWIQFSSGTTGSPKGLVITHQAAITNLAQMLMRSRFGAQDVELGWMPLFHDMGLVGCHLLALAAGAKQVRLAPEDFLRRPAIWMDLATTHKATLLTGTNTAAELFLRRVRSPVPSHWDLTSVRLLMIGAEPVSMTTLRALADRLEPAGLRREALHVPYGLAEATVGVSFSGPDEAIEPVTVSRKALAQGQAVIVPSSLADGIEIPDVGRPLDGLELRITDPDGVQLETDQVGEIQISGPNVSGTILLPDGKKERLGDWLRTGDLGFFHDDRLYVCGRIKEVLIQNGRNIMAQDAEAAAQIEGVRRALVCTIGQASEEEIALFIVPQDSSWKQVDPRPDHPVWQELAQTAIRARAALAAQTGLQATRTVVIAGREIPRTSSGKVRRLLLGRWLAEGRFADTERLLARAGAGASREPGREGRSSTGSTTDQETGQETDQETGNDDGNHSSSGTAARIAQPGDVLNLVRQTWAEVLGRPADSISAQQTFSSLGGTSVKAQEILGLLEDALGLDLSARLMAGDVTLARLSRDIEGLLSPRPSDIIPMPLPDNPSKHAGGAIAVVGLASRLGPTENAEDFFQALLDGRDLTAPLPHRWNGALTEGLLCRAGSFLPDPYGFDPSYFHSDEEEWIVTDPQQRLFLELSLTALETAGFGEPGRRGLVTGVFAGASQVGHGELAAAPPKADALLHDMEESGLLEQVSELDPDLAQSIQESIRSFLAGGVQPTHRLHPATLAGNLLNMIAARTAHELGLTGPALTLDSACSSTAVALHLACESLRNEECDLALAGGVNLNLTPTVYRFFEAAGTLSPSGRCRPFTDLADGFVPGEGGAVFLLTRLGDALARRDRILAVIEGSAVNNDGSALSVMAPNPEGQRRVIRRAWELAGKDMAQAAFIEAHGTGTAIGDPVEARVLDRLFPESGQRALGSVKANLGHLLGASAAAGLVKAILAIAQGTLPPAILEGRVNPNLGLSPKWVLPSQPISLGPGPILAGVSSFGFGGTNCHMVLGSPPRSDHRAAPLAREILRLSGPTPQHIQEQAAVLSGQTKGQRACDVAADLAQGRSSFHHRAFALLDPSHDPSELFAELARQGTEAQRWHRSEAPRPLRLAFLYPGQGSQRPFQALGLYQRLPRFRTELETLTALVPDQSLLSACYGAQASQEVLAPSNRAQPLLVAFQIAMTKVLRAAGIQPAAVCGHSVGELAAAWAAGMLDQDDAVRWAAKRGALMQSVEQTGTMAAAAAPAGQVQALLDPQGLVVVAATNGPGQTVLSGPTADIDDTCRRLEQAGIPTRPIPVGHAFHSPLMEPVARRLEEHLEELPTRSPLLPFASTLLGKVLVSDKPPENYWIDHLLQPVRFDEAFAALAELPIDGFVEIGPAGVLASLASRMLPRGDSRLVLALTRSDPEPDPDQDLALFQESLARLWAAGAPVDSEALWDRGRGPRTTAGPVMLRRDLRIPAATTPGPVRKRTWRALRPLRSRIQGTWLFLSPWAESSPSDQAASIAEAMVQAGGRVVWAQAARGLHRTAESRIEFDPFDPQQVEWALRMVGRDLQGLVLVNGQDPTVESDPADLSAATAASRQLHPRKAKIPGLGSDLDILQRTERFSTLLGRLANLSASLSKGLAAADLSHLQVTWVTTQATDAQAAPDPFAAAARSAALSALEERLDSPIDWLDLDGDVSPGTAAAVIAAGMSASVTSRGALRPLLEPMDASQPPALQGPAVILGSGGLASLLAPAVSRMGCRPLIIASRSPRRASLLAKSLRDQGHEADFLAMDLARPETVSAGLQAVESRYGRIGLVLHAATGLALGSLQSRTNEELASVLGPKITGSLALARALEDMPQTRVVLLSSLAGSLPALGGAMVDYAAANAFQDALAQAQRQRGRPWQALVLGPVRNHGVASGRGPTLARAIDPDLVAEQIKQLPAMDQAVCFLVHPKDARDYGRPAPASRKTGRPRAGSPSQGPAPHPLPGSPSPDGVADKPAPAFDPRAHRDEPAPTRKPGPHRDEPAPTPGPREERPDAMPPASGRPGRQEERSRLVQPSHREPLESPTQPGPPDDLERFLAERLAKTLRKDIEELDPHQPFQRMGLDSLTALDLVKEIEADLGLELPTTLLFEANSLSKLTEAIQRRLAEQDGTQGPGQASSHGSLESRLGAWSWERQTTAGSAHPTSDKKPFALLGSQETFLASNEYYPHLPGVVFLRLDLTGPMDESRLRRALDLLAGRHPMLSARFFWRDGKPVQLPAGGARPQLVVRLPGGREDPDRFCDQVERAAANEPFDLENGPVFRLTWCPLGSDRHSLMLALHHIAADAWSAGIVARELLAILAAWASNREPNLPALPVDFERACTELARPRSSRSQAQSFWAQHLAGAPTLISLPFDGDPAAEPKGPFAIHQVEADQRLTEKLEDLAQRLDVSFFSLLLLSYELAIFHWSKSREFLVRTANARRDIRLEGIDRIVGSFADSLPLRLSVDESADLAMAAQSVQEEIIASVRHADISSTELAGLAGKRLRGGPRGVTPAGISFPDFDAPVQVGPLTVQGIRAGAGAGLTQLGLIAWRFSGRLVLSYSFLEDLFVPKTIRRMAGQHLALIQALASADPDRSLASILHVALAEGSRPDRQTGHLTGASPQPSTNTSLFPLEMAEPLFDQPILAERLARSFEDHADATALSTEDSNITYRQLGESAMALAGTLTALGAGPGRLVGILARPGEAGLTAALGVIWSGAAYVPLDPDHPIERTRIIAKDAGIDLLVTTADLADRLPQDMARRLHALVLADRPEASGRPAAGCRVVGFAASPNQTLKRPGKQDPVYVMYTSGTTGRPKGVVVDNQALAPFHDWVASAFQVQPTDRFVQTSSLAFGGSIRQMYSPLLAGASVHPVAGLVKKDPRSLVEFLERHRITIWNSVPSLFLRLAEVVEDLARRGRPPGLESLRWILLGGENLPASQVRRWRKLFGTRHRIANLYGSTETVVNATWFEVSTLDPDWTSLPIGKARAGSLVTLRDERGRLVAPGQVGEILVGGPSLAQGYLGAADLTAEAFVVLDDRRFYRTGDLARQLPSGDLVFLGRRDSQVQIYGNRVELAEIEGLLTNHPSVRAAVVLARRDERTWRLTAWVEPANPAEPPDPTELRRLAASSLPSYMVPHEVLVRSRLPRNQAGKLDRRALAQSLHDHGTQDSASNELTGLVLEAFRQVLRKEDIDENEDFFDAGGDSILALELFRILARDLPDLPRPLVIYSHKSARSLAEAIARHQEGAKTASRSEPTTTNPDSWPLTPMQTGFLLMERLSGGATSNWSADIPLRGPLDIDAFTKALEIATRRHGVLRSALQRSEQGWRQVVFDQVPMPLEIQDISQESSKAQEAILSRSFSDLTARGLDPTQAPAWLMRLWKLGPEQWHLQLAFHHAFADGWSIALLGRELLEAHDALVAGRRALIDGRAPSYGLAARFLAGIEPAQRDIDYWKHLFTKPWPDPSLLQTASQRDGIRREPTAAVSTILDEGRSSILKQAAARFSLPISSIFLGLLAKVLAQRTGVADQVIGLAHSGRDLPVDGIEDIFGCLAQGLALRLDLRPQGDMHGADKQRRKTALERILRRAHEALTGALEHAIPPDRLASELGFGPNPPGSRFFLSIMDFARFVTPGTLRPDWEQSRFSFAAQATDTELLCSILTMDSTRITFHGTLPRSRRRDLLDDLLDEIDALGALLDETDDPQSSQAPGGPSVGLPQTGARQTTHRTEAALTMEAWKADAALVAYLPGPDRLHQLLAGLVDGDAFQHEKRPDDARSRAQFLAQMAASAQPAELLESGLGNSALYFLPLLADALPDADPGELAQSLVPIAEQAIRRGVSALSLAGMLPAVTGYGRLVAQAFDQAGLTKRLRLTTGHAATAAAICMNVESLLHRLDTDLSRLRLAVVGFGSVGRAATDLILAELGSPRELIICDRTHRLEILDPDISAMESSSGCPLRTLTALDRSLPKEILGADLIIGASSSADLLDPWTMEPGTILLDDSFPPICSPVAALSRMKEQGDILVAGAGRLDVTTLRRISPLAERLSHGATSPEDLAWRLGPGMAGCRLESLLLSRLPDLPAVIGPVQAEEAKAYLDAARRSRIQAAALHLGTTFLDDRFVTDFTSAWIHRLSR